MSEAPDVFRPAGQRGPAEHASREQILAAARDHFRHYGYAKTTVADIAKAIGFSKAYVYKFFDSKQAIGEAICAQALGRILVAAEAAASHQSKAQERYRRFHRVLVDVSAELLFNERRLYDIATIATLERWPPYTAYLEALFLQLRTIILFGRETGEFERETSLEETCHAILLVMQPFVSPAALARNLDQVHNGPDQISGLVLRSLAP